VSAGIFAEASADGESPPSMARAAPHISIRGLAFWTRGAFDATTDIHRSVQLWTGLPADAVAVVGVKPLPFSCVVGYA
jgi:hypothetical protein